MFYAYAAKDYMHSQTELMKAAQRGDQGEVIHLLGAKVDVTQKDVLGNTALKHALRLENNEVVVILLKSVHAQQFYREARTAKPDSLQTLLNKHTEEAGLTQMAVADYLFIAVEAEPDLDEKIALLEAAMPSKKATALSAFMSSVLGKNEILEKIEKMRTALLPEPELDKTCKLMVMTSIKK